MNVWRPLILLPRLCLASICPPDLPPTLHAAVLRVQAHPDLHDPERRAGAVYAWCLEWLKLRTELLAVAHAAPASQERT